MGASLGDLVTGLVEVLRVPLADPMRTEWIGIPTQGVQGWLEIELARHLGAGSGRADGVAANLDLRFPGDLGRRLRDALDHDRDGDDPWHIDRLVWATLDVLAEAADDPGSPIAGVAQLAGGASRYGQARSLADLIDRYLSNRPEMVRRWAAGDDVDGSGGEIGEAAAWQPALFRLVRQRIGRPSPAERLDDLLEVARSDRPAIDLPERLSLFGFSSLPGGRNFLHQLEALAHHRDVHLFLWQPSPGLGRWVARRVAESATPATAFGWPRTTDEPSASHDSELHPLIRSWAKPSREAAVLVADAVTRGARVEELPATGGGGRTLLAQLQDRLRGGMLETDPFRVEPADDSLVVLACHGQIRQVEVLRDEILRMLDADPTLDESDIVVLCPTLADYAPLIEAVFGPPATTGVVSPPDATPPEQAPPLSYQITDRSLTRLNPVAGALSGLLEMLSGRFAASVVTDFLGLAPVQARYGFTDDEFATITAWIEQLSVRWGLDASSRAPWLGVDEAADYAAGTWSAALDRLLLGVATSDVTDDLSVGGVLPFGVEGTGIDVAGRFAEFLTRLSHLAVEVTVARPVRGWATLLGQVVDDFFRAPFDQSWMTSSITAKLADAAERADAPGGAGAAGGAGGAGGPTPRPVDLTLADVRRLLTDLVGASSPATKFFRGGVTVTSLSPLRGVPHRVVCILGFDDEGLRPGGGDGDDLLALTPMIGDRDRRADVRQSLLEAVLAAGDRLVITRNGRNRVNNKEVPLTASLAELRDALVDGVTFADSAAVEKAVQLGTTCNGFDPANFRGERRSYDPVAFVGARVASGTQAQPSPFLVDPLPLDDPIVTVELADLHRMLRSPVEFFLTRRLEVRLDDADRGGVDDEIPLELDALAKWDLEERLLGALRSGATVERFRAVEAAKGTLPPGHFGEEKLESAEELAQEVLARAAGLGVLDLAPETLPIDLTLPSGVRVVGLVDVVRGPRHVGPVTLGAGKLKPKRRLRAWLDLLAVSAAHPDESWTALLIGAAEGSTPKDPVADQRIRFGAERSPAAAATDALEVLVDLYRRAHTEPLPIFAGTSPALQADDRPGDQWSRSNRDRKPYGDRHDVATQLAFGDLEFEELQAIPAKDDERRSFGSSQSSRVRLYAERLWGTFDDTCVVEVASAATRERGDG